MRMTRRHTRTEEPVRRQAKLQAMTHISLSPLRFKLEAGLSSTFLFLQMSHKKDSMAVSKTSFIMERQAVSVSLPFQNVREMEFFYLNLYLIYSKLCKVTHLSCVSGSCVCVVFWFEVSVPPAPATQQSYDEHTELATHPHMPTLTK